MKQTKQKRNNLVKKLFAEGMPEAEIGRMFNVSRQRIHQIVRNYSSYKPRKRAVDNFPLTQPCEVVK